MSDLFERLKEKYADGNVGAVMSTTFPVKEWEIIECLFEGRKHKFMASCLNEPPCPIHSVKRLSDGEVFSVGDTINWPKNYSSHPEKIKSFFIEHGKLFFSTDTFGGYSFTEAMFYHRGKEKYYSPPTPTTGSTKGGKGTANGVLNTDEKKSNRYSYEDGERSTFPQYATIPNPKPTKSITLAEALQTVIESKEFVVLHDWLYEDNLKKAFEAGRQSYRKGEVIDFPLFHASFPTFESYKNSLHKS